MEIGIYLASLLKKSLSVFWYVIPLLIYKSFQYLQESEDKYKWVRRQWRFLEAFSKDIRQIQDSVKEIKKIAPQQLRDSAELNLEGITVPLNEIETKWEMIGGPRVASNAERCLEGFEKLNADFLNRYLLVLFKLKQKFEACGNMTKTKEDVTNHLENHKDVTSDLHRLLSKNEIQGSQKPTSFSCEDVEALERVLNSITSSSQLEKLEVGSSMEEQLRSTVTNMKLMLAFVKDLQPLRLESELEKAWTKGAHDIIEEADQTIPATTRRLMISREKYKANTSTNKWPSALASLFTHLMATFKLERSINNFNSGFYDLLNAKDEYGLTFVVRDSSKLVLLQQRKHVETDISSALLGIHKQLTQKVPKRISKSKYSKMFGKLRQELEALQLTFGR